MLFRVPSSASFREGQVLLITIMLLATAITVVLSVSFKSVTETQVTKLEEENQKALAAAEAAIEASLKSGTNTTLGSGDLSSISGFTGDATVDRITSTTFTTPLLQKDEQYTLYLGTYDESAKTVSNGGSDAPIAICFKTSSPKPALDITLVKETGTVKYAVDPETPKRISNALGTNACSDTNYNYSFTVTPTNDSRLLIVRLLYAGGKLLFSRSGAFPAQGKTVSSTAQSVSGGAKKSVTLFQSYPQIPAEFFVTSF